MIIAGEICCSCINWYLFCKQKWMSSSSYKLVNSSMSRAAAKSIFSDLQRGNYNASCPRNVWTAATNTYSALLPLSY